MKIGVTGVGGGVGQSILKSLADTDYDIIAFDSEPLAAGLFKTKKSYLVPYANNQNYIVRLLEICQREKILLLFPGLDAELMKLSESKSRFEKIGTTIVVSSPEVIKISDNKAETYNTLFKKGISIPTTYLAKEFALLKNKKFPVILKQMKGGASSKNVFLIKGIKDWNTVNEKLDKKISNFIAMDYIEGDEYTCGTITLGGKCKGVIVMRRILRSGDTYKCFTEKNQVIESEVRKLVEIIKPFGACNIQLRLKNNKPYVFEINARCSGTTASRTLCGFNEPKMIADYLIKEEEPKYEIKEQTILRYFNELVVDNNKIKELKENKVITNHF